MSGMSLMQIARRFAYAFKDNKFVQKFASDYYGRDFTITIGAELTRLPSGDDAPLIVIFPDGGEDGANRAEVESQLGLVVALMDDEFQEINGVLEMRALARMDELTPLLQKAMREALPGAIVQNTGYEYEIVNFPVVLGFLNVNIQESLPIGGR